MKQKIENGIYKIGNTYQATATKRINGTNQFRSKKNLKTLGEARRYRKKFIEELTVEKARYDSGKLMWKDAVAEYLSSCSESDSYSTYYSKEKALLAH